MLSFLDKVSVLVFSYIASSISVQETIVIFSCRFLNEATIPFYIDF